MASSPSSVMASAQSYISHSLKGDLSIQKSASMPYQSTANNLLGNCKDQWSVISPLGDVSPCFVHRLFGVLGLFAVAAGIYRIVHLHRQKLTRTSNASLFFYIKLLLVSVQVMLHLVLFSVQKGDGVSLLNGAGALVVLVLHYMENYKSKVADAVLLIYWFASSVLFALRALNFGVRAQLGDSTAVCCVLASVNSVFVLIVEMTVPLVKPKFDDRENPYDKAHIFSKLTFSWMDGLIKLGYRKYLSEPDLPVLSQNLKASTTSTMFSKKWSEQQTEEPSIVVSLFWSFGGYYSLCVVYKLTQTAAQFSQPQLLKMLISFVNEYAAAKKDGLPIPLTKGFVLSVAMFATSLIQTFSINQYFLVMFNTSIKVKSSLISTVYHKAMVLSNDAKSASNTGDIVNLMSVDVQRLQDSVQTLQLAWSCPFSVIVCLVSLHSLVGNAMWAGVVIMVIMIPINAKIARLQKGLQKTQMKYKDERSRLMSEILNNIKSLKLYGWENPYLEKLNHVRNEKELKNLKKMGVFNAVIIMLWNFSPVMVSCCTFASFIFFGNGKTLTSEIVFPCLALFNLLAFPLSTIPQVISSLIETQVALGRLSKFLYSSELQSDAVQRYPAVSEVGDMAVEVKEGTFYWSAPKQDVPPAVALKDINFEARKGYLECIVGKVGSGKSSIIQAILGDLYKAQGQVSVHGTVAYVAQVPWIMNGSIKDNILFGHTYEPDFYEHVIKACALTVDLQILAKGDQTLVGEKGISLSGGQKARLSLARAVYARADVYLIDDALSAVDEHVGKHLIDHVIGPKGLLRSKCRILATNNIGVLSVADSLYMVSEGKIVERGSFKAIQDQPESRLFKLIEEFGKKTEAIDDFSDSEESGDEMDVKSLAPAELVPLDERLELELERREDDEEVFNRRELSEKGHVKWPVYRKYVEACNPLHFLFWVCVISCSMIVGTSSGIWLKHWSDVNGENGYNAQVGYYLGIYVVLGVLGSIFIMTQNCVAWLFCAIDASKALHNEMATRVLRAPMSFFETTPIGRVLNRFSNDIYRVDENLIRVFGQFFSNLFKAILSLAVICYSTWQVCFLLVPLAVLYLYNRKYYSRSSRELRRLESISRSPIFANFQETLNGINTIRAYGQAGRFQFLNQLKVDKNMRAYQPSMNSNRWLSVRLEFLGAMVIFGTAAFSIVALKSSTVSPGLVGLSLSYALSITQMLNALVRMSVEVETNIVSVERIMEYSKLETEAPAVIESHRPAADWPTAGNLEFVNYSTRYRPELDLVLKNISFSINAKEKVGIVGRTGAGKSSLTLALFRIIEAAEGHISIDDVDTSTIGLRDLRQHLSIIPQDSQVFEGTIRSNLDPFDRNTDDEIWNALKLAHLKTHVERMFEQQKDDDHELSDPLHVRVSEGGSNLSVGQRQLMCLARALLVHSHILVLDEATAAVDVETDQVLQTTIRSEFKDRTILTIAHRINTILDSDKIIVLEKGEVAEFDTPQNLLRNKSSLFYSLCEQGGFVKAEKE